MRAKYLLPPMSRIDLLPFSDEHLGPAGRLLAERHRRHREAEPALSRRFEDPEEARREVEAAWRREHASGAVALDDGRFAGYLIGAPRSSPAWGPNVWIEAAGHAAEDPELVRLLYGAAAVRWVEDARTAHYALVPASDAGLVDAWFRLGFGQQHAHGVREVPPVAFHQPPGITVRRAGPADVDAAVTLDLVLPDYQVGSPVFSRGPMPRAGDVRDDIAEELSDPARAVFLAETDGRPVGASTAASVKESSAHSGLARPEAACILGFAATLPEFRGRGVGLALTEAVFEWARNSGYSTIVVDWRVTNLSASAFWPKRGFRPSFLRLYRSIP
jgi:GNAT superfamily N-acetyltransferase